MRSDVYCWLCSARIRSLQLFVHYFELGYIHRQRGLDIRMPVSYTFQKRQYLLVPTNPVLLYGPLLELAHCHVLSRIFYYVPYFAPLDPGKVLSTFGTLSALIEGLNGPGVSLRSNTKATHQALGNYIIIAALVLQLVVIAISVALAAIFDRRCAKANMQVKAISSPLLSLYIISTPLVSIRCIYRLVEAFGNTTVRIHDLSALMTLIPTLRYEWFFYVFEATLMLVNSVLWNYGILGAFCPWTTASVWRRMVGPNSKEKT